MGSRDHLARQRAQLELWKYPPHNHVNVWIKQPPNSFSELRSVKHKCFQERGDLFGEHSDDYVKTELQRLERDFFPVMCKNLDTNNPHHTYEWISTNRSEFIRWGWVGLGRFSSEHIKIFAKTYGERLRDEIISGQRLCLSTTLTPQEAKRGELYWCTLLEQGKVDADVCTQAQRHIIRNTLVASYKVYGELELQLQFDPHGRFFLGDISIAPSFFFQSKDFTGGVLWITVSPHFVVKVLAAPSGTQPHIQRVVNVEDHPGLLDDINTNITHAARLWVVCNNDSGFDAIENQVEVEAPIFRAYSLA